jgi:hypothetical protein
MLYDLLGIGLDELVKEEAKLGRVIMGPDAPFFRIPLVYELDGSSVLMYIDTPNIYQREPFTIDSININRTFGAVFTTDEILSSTSSLNAFGSIRNETAMFATVEHGMEAGGTAASFYGNFTYNPVSPHETAFPYNMVHPFINLTTRNTTQLVTRYNFLYGEWAAQSSWESFLQLYTERTKI